MVCTIRDIVENVIRGKDVNNPQTMTSELSLVWDALVEEIHSQLLRGIGVVLRGGNSGGLGAFVFVNDAKPMSEGGAITRTPMFVFNERLLQRVDYTVSRENNVRNIQSNWGSLYDTHPPLQPLSVSRVGQRAGISSTAEAQKAVGTLLGGIENAMMERIPIDIRFGEVARMTSTPTSVRCVYGKSFLEELKEARTADGKPMLSTTRSTAASAVDRDSGMLTSTLWTGTRRYVQ